MLLCKFPAHISRYNDLTFREGGVIFVLYKKGVSHGFSQIFMAPYQSNSDYCCSPDLHDCCRFCLAASAPSDLAAAPVCGESLALCRSGQGLVRNSLPGPLMLSALLFQLAPFPASEVEIFAAAMQEMIRTPSGRNCGFPFFFCG